MSVTQCPYTPEELEELKNQNRAVGYLPEELALANNLNLLKIIWPEIVNILSVAEENYSPIINEFYQFGWFDYSTSVKPPYRDLSENKLRQKIKKAGRVGMNLNEYIVTSFDNKFLHLTLRLCIDKIFTMGDLGKYIKFEWDKGNIDKSYKKHGISPNETEEIFLDDDLKILKDIKHSQKEARLIALGKTFSDKKLFVVFTARDEKIRVISTRPMSKKEKKYYEKT